MDTHCTGRKIERTYSELGGEISKPAEPAAEKPQENEDLNTPTEPEET